MMMRRFNSILIANRGEIAVRIIRTARILGYRTIAVYSDADSDALHVQLADEAIWIGSSPSSESYFRIDLIIEAAKKSNAGAIHPGYGFLSENAELAIACLEAGFVFIGPSAEAIDLMGNKAAAKRHMIAAGVPCTPGYEGADQTDTAMKKAADEIGFPIMIKAAAGGGGRGMRLALGATDFLDALAAARAEASASFGSNEIILEVAIAEPRHIEIQIIADKNGNTVHLGERDCSVQRRHQKIIEESPSPAISDDLREEMGAAAAAAARSINYVGAGTVEFLLDDAGNYYFIEMNTRLQVEHPVTEMVTGLDLVALQISVAQGEALELDQATVNQSGHAIEARLYAEDPTQNFLPQSGRIDVWKPQLGAGLRLDSGVERGSEVSPFYDPMIAKFIAHGENREAAREKLIQTLRESVIFGVFTNRSFLLDLLRNQTFANGNATTALIDKEFSGNNVDLDRPSKELTACAAVLFFVEMCRTYQAMTLMSSEALHNWSSAGVLTTPIELETAGTGQKLSVLPVGKTRYSVDLDEEHVELEIIDRQHPLAGFVIDGQRLKVHFNFSAGDRLAIAHEGRTFSFNKVNVRASSMAEAQGRGRVTAPMHGTILEIRAKVGDVVSAGDTLAVLEAMKMQHQIRAEVAGRITEASVKPGEQISKGAVLFDIEKQDEA